MHPETTQMPSGHIKTRTLSNLSTFPLIPDMQLKLVILQLTVSQPHRLYIFFLIHSRLFVPPLPLSIAVAGHECSYTHSTRASSTIRVVVDHHIPTPVKKIGKHHSIGKIFYIGHLPPFLHTQAITCSDNENMGTSKASMTASICTSKLYIFYNVRF